MLTESSHHHCTLLMRCCKFCKLLLPDFSVTFHTTKTLSHWQKHEWGMTGFLSTVIDYYYQVKKKNECTTKSAKGSGYQRTAGNQSDSNPDTSGKSLAYYVELLKKKGK